MKKTLLAILATTFTLAAQADIIKLNVYQNQFVIENSARFIHILSAKIQTVPSMIDQINNPLFDVFSGESAHSINVLKEEKVVQLTVSYEHEQYGETESNTLNINLPLSSFSTEDFRGKRIPYSVIKKKIKMEVFEKGETYTETVCKDTNYDDYNRGMEGCLRKEELTRTLTKTILKVTRK